MNTSHHKWIWVLIIIVALVVIAAVIVFATGGTSSQSTSQQMQAEMANITNINATFSCDNGKTINAMFMNATTSTTTGNEVMLSLSDGRQMTLPQVISADGARYADSDQSFVFWNVGNQATIWENGSTTYTNCVTSNS